MTRAYTIPSFKNIDSFVDEYGLQLVQATLPMNVFPSKRNLPAVLATQHANVPIIVHYDFVYTISRWLFFRSSVKQAILNELASLKDSRILGVVMHADDPLSTDIRTLREQGATFTRDFVLDAYKSSIWDISTIVAALNSTDNLFDISLRAFINDYKEGPKILLENTVKTPGGVYSLLQYRSPLIDICYDTEHEFAQRGNYDFLGTIQSITPVLVHLNPIPKEVKPCSYLDRHSDTSLAECSVHELAYYYRLMNELATMNTPFIRECYVPTMLHEISQLC